MNPLQYTSEEMFSSTELIRKSKAVFDKLNNKEIEKAIILRDGKPSFMLLDFSEYEKLMSEYLSLKQSEKNHHTKAKEKKSEKKKYIPEEENSYNTQNEKNEIDEKDLEEALAEIENLDLESIDKLEKSSKESLNDFWEES